MSLRLLIAAVLAASSLSKAGAEASDEVSCNLYLAFSEVFGRLGVFTRSDLEKGTVLNAQDIVVPLIEDEGPLWNDIRWSHLLGYVEWEGRAVRALFSGTGGAINVHSTLYNVEPVLVADHAQNSGLHRKKDAGAGAFSYQVMQYIVTSPIPAGGQILLQNVDSHQTITDAEYDIMDAAVETVDKMLVDVPESHKDAFLRHILKFARSGMMASFSDTFPSTPVQFQRAKDVGVAKSWTYDDSIVSPAWLNDNGKCLDNLQPGASAIDQAGRGAFAHSALKEGSVVVPAPVIPISRFNLEKFEDDEHQLLRNYCYGHFASSLLLCPYGSPASFVNHAGDGRANVKMVWSTTLDSKHEIWSNKSVAEILRHPEPGLVFDLVATRNIADGEEILLDYGDSWDEDWERHVEWWEPSTDAQTYQSATQLNDLLNSSHIRTDAEQSSDPYPQNVLVAARYDIDRSANPKTEERHDRVTIKTYAWEPPRASAAALMRGVHVVHVVQRKRGIFGGESYVIELLNHPLALPGDPQFIKKTERIIVTGVPREVLHFVDAPYSSDHHLDNAFRCEIQIPDEIFPAAWADLMDGGDLHAAYEDPEEEEL